MLKRALIVLIGLFSSAILAQIEFTHYKTENGLPHDFTFNTHQDTTGYIWVGTDDGLAKFDGVNFSVFNKQDGLSSNYIIDVINYNRDTLAVATWKGGVDFLSNGEVCKKDNPVDKNARIHRLHLFGKDLIASHYGKHTLYKNINGLSFRKTPLSFPQFKKNESNDVEEFSTMASVNGLLYFYQGFQSRDIEKTGSLFGIYEYKNQNQVSLVFPFLKNTKIHSFGKYGKSEYFATTHDTLIVFSNTKIIKKNKIPFNNNTIHKFLRTTFFDVYVVRNKTTNNDEIHLFDVKKNKWENLTQDINATILVSDVFLDRYENVWITSKSDGLYKLNYNYSCHVETILANEDITDIAFDYQNNVVLFLAVNKIIAFSKSIKKDNLIYLLDGSVNSFSSTLIKNKEIGVYNGDNNRQIGTFNGSEVLETNWLTKKLKGIDIYYNRSCVSISKNNNEQKSGFCTWNHSKDFGSINDAGIVDNDIWVATTKGIVILDSKTLKSKNTAHFNFDNQSFNVLKIIGTIDNSVWLLTSKGVCSIQKNGKNFLLNSIEELSDKKINDAIIDHRNILWITTQKDFGLYNNGLYYKLSKRKQVKSSSFSKIKEDKNHHIWVSGNKGVVKFDNTLQIKPVKEPQLLIIKEDVKFSVSTIDFSGNETLVQYKAMPSDKWKPLESSNLDFQNYAIGKYEVKFRARNLMSNWVYSESFTLSIVEKWYKSLWFIVLIVLFVFSLIYYRYKKVKEKNIYLFNVINESEKLKKELDTVRDNLAKDFHDYLGNKLARITVLSSQLQRKKVDNVNSIQKKLKQIEEDSNDLYQGTKDFIWALKTENNSLEELITYVSDYGENYISEMDILFDVFKDIDKGVKLPKDWNGQLVLIFNEAITNAVKHSKCKAISASFIYKNSLLEFALVDDGKGFDVEQVLNKNGLSNMRQRASRIGGCIDIESSIKGTKVVFRGKISITD